MKRIFAFAILLPLALVTQSCGKSDGYAVSHQDVNYEFVFFGNYGSSALAPFVINSTGGLTRAANTIATGTGTSSVVDIVVSPNKLFLYAANRNTDNVSAYNISSIDSAVPAALAAISGAFSFTTGTGASSISITPGGDYMYVTNSTASGNNISILSLNTSSGGLISTGSAAAKTNPISSVISLGGDFLFVANRGTSDISSYSIHPTTGALSTIALSTSTGTHPEQVLIHPNGNFLYSLCSTANAIYAYSIGVGGGLTATSPASFATGSSPIRMSISPDGNYLYVSNNGDNTVSIYAVDSAAGTLSEAIDSPLTLPAGMGAYAIAVSPSGKTLVVTGDTSGTAVSYDINSSSGQLTNAGGETTVGTNPRSAAFVLLPRAE